MASTYLSMTGTGDAKKWTFSGWFKKALNGSEQRLITSSDNSTYDDYIRFNSDDTISIGYRNAVVIKTNRKFRDNNAFYHIVVKVDTDQTTVNNRIILYVNGIDERVNGYSTDSLPGQGLTGYLNYNVSYIGVTNPTANSNHFNGIMSHINFTDAYAYDASAFGETDATTGEWKIKTSPSVTYGTNGFFILKDGNSVTDQSGNSNNFTVGGGTLTKTEDSPSNVFATWNFLSSPSNGNVGDVTGSNGNTTTSSLGTGYRSYPATLGYTTGKFYWEIKRNNTTNDCHLGITNEDLTPANQATWIGNTANGWMYGSDGGLTYNSGTDTNTGYSSSTTGDIIMVAHDATNGKLYFGKNGSWQGSSNPSTEASPAFTGLSTSKFWFPAFSGGSSNSANFGNGYFGTTAVSSAGTNASGIGIFEFDVPNGFTALSTKGLNL